MSDLVDRLLQLHNSGDVRRYHTVPGGPYESVAGHSWGVALLVAQLHPNPSRELLLAALYHDIPESLVGDIPATGKWRWPNLRVAAKAAEETVAKELTIWQELTPEEHEWLSACDMLDLCFYTYHQVQLGNAYMMKILYNGYNYLRRFGPREVFQVAEVLYNHAQERRF